MQFTHHCSACERTQLIFGSQVLAATATERGTALTFTCWCGAAQEHVLGQPRSTGAAERQQFTAAC